MTQTRIADDDVQISLLAMNGHAGLAADLLVNRFGLTEDYAQSVLDQGYGLLIARMGRARAKAALPLLSTLGLHVAIQPCEALPPDEYCDLSVRIAEAKHARKAIATIERLAGITDITVQDFGGPSGLVIPRLPLTRADWLAHSLKRLPGVSASVSEVETARFDLFAEAELTEAESLAVRRHLRLMDCAVGGFSDALGCGLDRRALNRMLERFPGLGLFGVNQAFQRHELLVIGRGSLSQQELVDFLMTRPIAQQVPAHQLMRALPLKVEANLTRTAAGQFLSDYSSIGMQAITRLVRRVDLVPKNP